MNILDRLSSVRGERDNLADIALAEELAASKDLRAIRELVDHLTDRKRRLQSDCIKTLYELGEREPALIAPYVDDFAAQLTSKNPRMIWGAMCALNAATTAEPGAVYPHLSAIVKAAEGESVIARDHCVFILAKLCRSGYQRDCFPILLTMIRTAPINQLPSYCERAAEAANGQDRKKLVLLITKRLEEVEQRPKRARIEKVLKRLRK